jgi:ubiquitin carboxyl-terminal hydrolase 34
LEHAALTAPSEEENPEANPLIALLVRYTALVCRFLLMDRQTLIETMQDNGAEPDLAGKPHFMVFSECVVNQNTTPLWHLLSENDWNIEALMNILVDEFISQRNDGFNHLVSCVTFLLDRTPLDWEYICTLFTIATGVIRYARSLDDEHSTKKENVARQALTMFRTFDEKIRPMIVKQSSSLTLEVLKQSINTMSEILEGIYTIDRDAAIADTPAGHEDAVQKFEEQKGSESRERSQLNALSWKFDILLKCITDGRMESRITGVELMSSSLLQIWSLYVKDKEEGSSHILPSYCANFILEKKLVDYLVGVGSHPQLIQRSKNIIGFLVVTANYGQRETDVIWNSMLSSQDPRTLDATLDMLRSIAEFAHPPALSYFCAKLMDLPIHAFETRMGPFVKALTITWTQQAKGEGKPYIEPICFDLWIRILRESVGEPSLPAKRKRELWQYGVNELRNIANYNLDIAAKTRICKRCLQDISESSTASTGSVMVLNIFLDAAMEGVEIDGEILGTTESFAQLLIQDWSNIHNIQEATGMSPLEFPEVLGTRLLLMQKVLIQSPDRFPAEIVETLWNYFVGPEALRDEARDCAWNMLARIASVSSRSNPILDRCINEFFPLLNPSYMTPQVLDFASQVSNYQSRLVKLGKKSTEQDKSLPGDLFWHIALTVQNQDTANRATSGFVERNISLCRSLSRELAAERHAVLVDRCIQQLTDAAVELKSLHEGASSTDDESMIIVASENDLQAAKLRFTRSLAILKSFLQRIKDWQRNSPIVGTYSSPSIHSTHGDEIIFQYQPHSGGKASGTFSLKIGDQSRLKDLVARLSKSTGFSAFNMFSCGQRVDQVKDAETPICDIKALESRVLLIQKVPGTPSAKGTGLVTQMLPLEQQVMKHFKELHNLLEVHDELGMEVYEFLVTFPPDRDVVSTITNTNATSDDIFPLNIPFKTLYSTYVLKHVLAQRLQEGAACHELLQTTVQRICYTLIKFGHKDRQHIDSLESQMCYALTLCLLHYLRETVPSAVASSYFSEPTQLVDCLISLLFIANQSGWSYENGGIIQNCFAICLEASLHSQEVWQYFRKHESATSLLKTIWLQSSNAAVRGVTVQTVKGICAALPSLTTIDGAEFIDFFWENIVAILPETTNYGKQTKQFFDIALTIFRSISDEKSQSLPLTSYLETWSTTLLKHEHDEFVGRWSTDDIVDGLTEMIQWCIQLLKARKTPLERNKELMAKIFTTHAFPPIEIRDESEFTRARVPVLERDTRHRLYRLIHSLANDASSLHCLIKLLRQLLPEALEQTYGWSLGLAQPKEDDRYDLIWNVDRSRVIRSHTGYSGLRNLSNTCYFNSLFMQLFMNVTFRQFMLSANVLDSRGTQILLFESKKLFAYLQETWLQAVDPTNVIEHIVTFDGEPIDVHIQMDVDEFYNLLFDRWESQILSESDKQTFRKFYGGQLVQQIKSQDCPHVSERFEPFSVIQCEIQGKANLVESLGAFIEGEIMQGDNKYKCSSCDSYVNAVKRACLKDVPDNLIFHLKRFDYDLVSGTRSKINDYFEFPFEIDMAPYNVEYLKDTQQTLVPDKFMLVGVLVHSGNAEAGHYYSFIRERPGVRDNWVEMNDADITPYDPGKIADSCFGGWDTSYNPPFMKSWNAYMLFYQRIESVVVDESKFPTASALPARANIPLNLANRLNTENENWIRKYCLLDVEYAAFFRDVLEQYRNLNRSQCTEEHKIEMDLIQTCLQQFDLIFSRQRDNEYSDRILASLEKIIERCSTCSRIFLSSLFRREGTFRALLLRCPDERIKRKLAFMLLSSLKVVKEHDPQAYNPEIETSDDESSHVRLMADRGYFAQALGACFSQLDTIHILGKAWDDYFGILCHLASFGRWERAKVHEYGYLTITLQILFVTGQSQGMDTWHVANNYLKFRNKRRYSLRKVVALATILLQGALDAARLSDSEDGFSKDYPSYELAAIEIDIIKHFGPSSSTRGTLANTVLQGVLRTTDLEFKLYHDFVNALNEYSEGVPELMRAIYNAILGGTTIDPASLAGPYLHAALAFCQTCSDARLVQGLISRYAEEVPNIGDSGGAEHLDFFDRLRRISNPHFTRRRPTYFKELVTKKLPTFAPHLLFYPDEEVRVGIHRLIKNLLLDANISQMDEEYLADNIRDSGRSLTEACVRQIEQMISRGKAVQAFRVNDLLTTTRSLIQRFYEDDEELDTQRMNLKLASKYSFLIRVTRLMLNF